MIFRPSIAACLWDTWLFYRDRIHYLFYLMNSRIDSNWDGIGVATSADGVHFKDHGPIIHKADDAVWLGSGMTWEVEGKYYLNFSELRAGHQEINIAESDDLLHWRRLPAEYVSRLDPKYYNENPALTSERWDAIWVLPEENGKGYVGYLTAVAKEGPVGLCGTAGFVVSADGKHFNAAPPVIETGFWGDGIEVAAVEKIGSLYYMLIGVYQAPLGARHLSRLPAGECGMYVATSKTQYGPFRLQKDQQLLLGSSPSVYTYFARFYQFGSEILVNHHAIARTTAQKEFNAGPNVMFAPLKRASVNENGILSLCWWPGNEALKGRQLPSELAQCTFSRGLTAKQIQDDTLTFSAPANAFAYLPFHYDLEKGVVIEATLTLLSPTWLLSSIGLFVEGQPPGSGSVALIQSNDWFTIGPYNGFNFKSEDSKPIQAAIDKANHWRILIRGPYIEVYVDNSYVQSYTFTHPNSGRLGFVVEAGSAKVQSLKVWEMSF
jgi:hypothetical protein